MKKINRLLFTITIVLTAFIGLRNVNADTILNPDATCGDFPKDGDALITNCSSSGEESDLFDVTITNWYKGDLYSSSTTAPGEAIGTTGVYESGYKYYLELKFKPKDGNEFDDNVNFNILGLSDGTVMVAAPNGEYIVIFEFVVHHIVHFETYGGTPIEDIVEDEWCSFDIDAIDDPIKDGYTFLGWYEDPEFEYNYWGSCLDESITLYAKFVETSKIINNISVTLYGPTIGKLITSSSYTDPEWGAVIFQQEPRPTAIIPNDANYVVDSVAWVKGLCDYENELYLCDEYFEGEIEDNTYYYAEIGIEANEGYAINSDVTIKVNGEDPEEVFAVYESTYTRFIAKVKSRAESNTMITANKTTIDFGETFAGLENDAYLALGQKVVFTNTGITTVKFDIYNPTSQGFGCAGFDSDLEIAPGETMEITLIPHPSYIFSKDPGTYNGTYVITATNVDDESDSYPVEVSAKIIVLDNNIENAKVTGAVVKVYNGYYQKQTALVVTLNGKKLTLGKDYKLLYSNNKNIGTAKYSITGIGNYSGKIYKTFSIIPKKVTINSVTPGTKKLTVKYKAVTGTVKYQVAYKLKTNSTYKTVTKLTKTSYTVSKLTSGKYYNVKVRAYKIVNGKTYYGAWSLVKTVKVK